VRVRVELWNPRTYSRSRSTVHAHGAREPATRRNQPRSMYERGHVFVGDTIRSGTATSCGHHPESKHRPLPPTVDNTWSTSRVARKRRLDHSNYRDARIQSFAFMQHPSLYGTSTSDPSSSIPPGLSLSSLNVPYLRAHWPTHISTGFRATGAFASQPSTSGG